MKTFKSLAIFCLGALLFTACAEKDSDETTGLVLSADKYDIYNDENAEDGMGVATLKLTYNGNPVTDMGSVEFVCFKNGKMVFDILEINGSEVTFSSTELGKYSFEAMYGTMKSNVARISVLTTPPPAPEVPTDNNKSNLNFKRRVLLTQFTGTGCPNCPYMVNAIHTLMRTTLANDVVLTAVHLYNENDPAYLAKAPNLDDAVGVYNYPWILADLKRTSFYDGELRKCEPTYDYLQPLVQYAINRTEVKGGIAVNCEYKPDEGYVMVTALVKAKSTAEFRVGAWLVEDKVEGTQANKGITADEGVNFDIHNNCVRVAHSARGYNDFTGFSLGTITSGNSASQSFALPLLPNGAKGNAEYWNHENLRVVVFISTMEEDQRWYVNNVITAPINGEQDFEYVQTMKE